MKLLEKGKKNIISVLLFRLFLNGFVLWKISSLYRLNFLTTIVTLFTHKWHDTAVKYQSSIISNFTFPQISSPHHRGNLLSEAKQNCQNQNTGF